MFSWKNKKTVWLPHLSGAISICLVFQKGVGTDDEFTLMKTICTVCGQRDCPRHRYILYSHQFFLDDNIALCSIYVEWTLLPQPIVGCLVSF